MRNSCKFLLNFAIILFIWFSFAGCKTDANYNAGIKIGYPIRLSGTGGIAVYEGTVYISGWDYYGNGNNYSGCYWIDGVKTTLPKGSSIEMKCGIIVHDGTVYVYGWYNGNLCYWRNGNKVDLSLHEETSSVIAECIAVQNNNTYLCGSYFRSSKGIISGSTVCYWINGERTDLYAPDRTYNASTSGFAVNDGAIYTSGHYQYSDYSNRMGVSYWVNETRVDLPLPEDVYSAYSSGIAVPNDTVYTSGHYRTHSNYTNTACYWTNEIRTDLSVPEAAHNVSAYTTDIIVVGDSVYVSGYCFNPYTACYWVDGNRIDLPLPEESTDVYTYDISVHDGIVYVTGSYSNSINRGESVSPRVPDISRIPDICVLPAAPPSKACYWANGIRTDLSIPEGADTRVSGITVQNDTVYVSGYYSYGSHLIACYWVNGERIDLTSPEKKQTGIAHILQ